MFNEATYRLLPSVLQARRLESINDLRRAVAEKLSDEEIQAVAWRVRQVGAADSMVDWELVEEAIERADVTRTLKLALECGDTASAGRTWARLKACWPDHLDPDLEEPGHTAFQSWGRYLRTQQKKIGNEHD